MQDSTEGMELIPDESLGRYYTASELKALADEGAEAEGGPLVVESLTQTEFVVRFKTANRTIEMTVAVHLDYERGGNATRSLLVWRPEGQGGAVEREEELPSLDLKTDGKNPTVYIDDSKLTRADLINALINPVAEAARRIEGSAA